MRETKETRASRQLAEEQQFVAVLRKAGNLVEAEAKLENREHPSHPLRIDYLINGERQFGLPIALEIQGFGFGHLGRAGWLRDIRKAQAIAAKGWRYVPVTRDEIANGNALEALARCHVSVEAEALCAKKRGKL